MLPCGPIDYAANQFGGYLIAASECRFRDIRDIAELPRLPYFQNFGGGEFRQWMIFALNVRPGLKLFGHEVGTPELVMRFSARPALSSFLGHVGHIFGVTPWRHMVRVAARRVVAGVARFFFGWINSSGQKNNDTANAKHPIPESLNQELAVSALVPIALPWPTGLISTGSVDHTPDPCYFFFGEYWKWVKLRSHRRALHWRSLLASSLFQQHGASLNFTPRAVASHG